MPNVRKETIAIVQATFDEVNSRHAEIMLRMWHHLLPYPERNALLADYDGTGQSLTLIQALLAGSKTRSRGTWPRMRPATGVRQEHLPLLERAFRLAMKDVLGRTAAPMVVNAWSELLCAFLVATCRMAG